MRWEQLQIGDLVETGEAQIQTGPFGTQLKASHYTAEGTPVINVRNIGYSDLRVDSLEYVPDRIKGRLKQHILAKDDIVFGRKGAVDRHAIIDKEQSGWIQGSDCIRLRLSTSRLNAHYLSYALLSKTHKKWMLAQASNKATMASLNHDVISRIPFTLPPLPVQDRIISELGQFKNLIENNRRRIALLEQAARLLYEEWFVRFRFPGHEHAKFSNGLPEEWFRKPASECMDILSGGTPKTDNSAFWDGEIPFYTPKDADPSVFVFDTDKHLTEKGLKSCNSQLYPEKTLLITARGTVGKMNLAGQPMAMNQSCYALVAYAPLTQEFLYFAMSFGVKELRSQAGGAVFDAIIRDTFKFISVVVPSEEIVKRFTEIIHPYLKSISNSQAQIRALQSSRDLLLPQLMSGEVEV